MNAGMTAVGEARYRPFPDVTPAFIAGVQSDVLQACGSIVSFS